MLHRRAAAMVVSVVLMLGLLPSLPATAAPAMPSRISSVSAQPGPQPGEVTFRWSGAGQNTRYYLLETGLTSFSPSRYSSLPRHGRSATYFRISPLTRSFTLTAAQTAAAGAGLGTGRHLYYRIFAVNESGSSTATRAYPSLGAVMPRGLAANAVGTPVRMATFNVRTARARSDKRHWQVRAASVAREIAQQSPGVVAIQELSPGRVDGKNGSTLKVGRQTTSLTDELAKIGAGRYKLVRSTFYVKSGTKFNTQGARILYDSELFSLSARQCPEKTGKKYYNGSCTVTLPLLKGDSENLRRKAAFAMLTSRATGKSFYVVSAHLDPRHSSSASTEARYNDLRGAQVRAILAKVDAENSRGLPVLFGADINSWQNNRVGDAPHEALVAAGYYDGVAAIQHVNLAYPTVNHYRPVLKPKPSGFGTRIDVVMVRGARGSNLYHNVLRPEEAARPADHNLVLADLVL